MIHAEGLTKNFGARPAVDRLSLEVEEGEVFGFLGPNGAGKTTTVRMLTSLIAPTSGSATVAGCELGREADELRLRSKIGLLPENVGLYEGSSAYQNLEYFGRLQRLDERTLRTNIERYLRMVELWDERDRPVATFSKGMKQKVAIARALVHDPLVLFLDEPTANLDPEAAKTVRDFILQLKRERRTIFLNTHHLDEAERVCDRVGILRTRLLTVGSPQELKRQLWGSRTLVRVAAVTDPLIAELRTRLAPRRVEVEGDAILIDVRDPDAENPEIAEAVLAGGGRLRQMSQLSPSLEDVYLQLIHGTESAG
jgi:ABC-2 type transport system ATP-binding protein